MCFRPEVTPIEIQPPSVLTKARANNSNVPSGLTSAFNINDRCHALVLADGPDALEFRDQAIIRRIRVLGVFSK